MPPNSKGILDTTRLPRDFAALRNRWYDPEANVYRVEKEPFRYPSARLLGYSILDETPDYTITIQELADADRLLQAAEAYAQTTETPNDYILSIYRRAKYYATQGAPLHQAVRQAYKDEFGTQGVRWLEQYEKNPEATLSQLITTNPKAKQAADAYRNWKNENFEEALRMRAQNQLKKQTNNLWQSILKPETIELPHSTRNAIPDQFDLEQLGK